MLRKDEHFVKDCLVAYLGSDATTVEEGEDPPDIYLTINNNKIAVEITRLSPVTFDDNGSPQKALRNCFGEWKDKDHPEMREGTAAYIAKTRKSTRTSRFK